MAGCLTGARAGAGAMGMNRISVPKERSAPGFFNSTPMPSFDDGAVTTEQSGTNAGQEPAFATHPDPIDRIRPC